MNFFSSDEFLESLAESFFPGQERSIGLFEVEGKTYRLLQVGRGRVITEWPFLDFVEPVDPSGREGATVRGGADARPARLGYLPFALRGILPLSQWRPDALEAGCEPCPFVDWSAFSGWEAYQEHLRGTVKLSDSRRRLRLLERDVGPVRVAFQDPEPDGVLAQCLRWKSEQYRESGYRDWFADRRYVALLEGVHARGALVFSSLRAGGRLVAAHLSALHEGRLCSWIPAFDRSLGRGSPGRLLLEAMLEESWRAGHRELDFLIGGETYKFDYATHVRAAGPVGTPPLLLRARREARRTARDALRRWPWLEARARAARRAWISSPLRPLGSGA